MSNFSPMNERSFLNQFLRTRKLTLWDNITLTAFFLVDIVCALITHTSIEDSNKTKALICIAVPFVAFYLINSTSFSNRFTNFTLSVSWIILSISFIIFGQHTMMWFNCVPLLEFMLYQILRFLFWRKYSLEFIPADIYRNKVEDHHNEVEQRANNENDKRYMKYLLWIGMLILMGCMFSMIGLHV